MRSSLLAFIIVLLTSYTAMAGDDPNPWYETHPGSVKTLKQALSEEREFLEGNPYWHSHSADAKTCAALKSVGLTCDFNTRATLTDFLTVNGKALFPAEGGTNPYYTADVRADEIKVRAEHGWPAPINNGFIGRGRQNAMLAAAVRRNARLFHNGDLAAADVRKKWR